MIIETPLGQYGVKCAAAALHAAEQSIDSPPLVRAKWVGSLSQSETKNQVTGRVRRKFADQGCEFSRRRARCRDFRVDGTKV